MTEDEKRIAEKIITMMMQPQLDPRLVKLAGFGGKQLFLRTWAEVHGIPVHVPRK